MRLIIDASAVTEIVLDRERSNHFNDLVRQADVVLAPELLIPELVNTIWKYHQFNNWNSASCEETLQEGIALVDSLVSCRELYREAFLLARTTRKPAYDMFYLALARREDGTLLTLDKNLRKEAAKQGVRVL